MLQTRNFLFSVAPTGLGLSQNDCNFPDDADRQVEIAVRLVSGLLRFEHCGNCVSVPMSYSPFRNHYTYMYTRPSSRHRRRPLSFLLCQSSRRRRPLSIRLSVSSSSSLMHPKSNKSFPDLKLPGRRFEKRYYQPASVVAAADGGVAAVHVPASVSKEGFTYRRFRVDKK